MSPLSPQRIQRGMDQRFRLEIEGPPRLRALALRRARLLMPECASDVAREVELPEVTLGADIVVDPVALRSAIATAVRASASLTLSAATAVGGRVPAGRIAMANLATQSAFEAPIGIAILRRFNDPPTGERGLNAFAPAYGVSGYGSASRNLLIGMRTAGVDVRLIPEWKDIFPDAVDRDEMQRILNLSGNYRAGDPTIFYRPATNVDGTSFLEAYRERRSDGASIAYTMFETDAIPGRWPGALNTFDRVWVPTTYNAQTFAAAGVDAERIRVVPIGLDTAAYTPDGEALALDGRRTTTFLSIFEWSPRKGADVLLRAWAEAFGPGDDVTLFLRTGTSADGAEATLVEALRATGLRREALAPIVLLHEALPGPAYRALFRAVDAFVLTSRGEGFCIPILEAMALGKPAIGTGFGGSADFLTGSTGFPIPAHIVPVDEAFARRVPLYRGQRWNDPSVTATAAALRAVVDRADDANARAAIAFARAHVEYDRSRLGKLAARELDDARPRGRRATIGRVTVIGPATADDASGDATRELLRLIAARGVAASLEDTTTHPAALDYRSAQRIADARSRRSGGARLAVDSTVPSDITYLTVWPADAEPLHDGRFVWVSDSALHARAAAGGISSERLRLLPLGVDTDFWTTDTAEVREPEEFTRVLIADDPEWETVLAACVARFGRRDGVGFSIFSGGEIGDDLDRIRHTAGAILGRFSGGDEPLVALSPSTSPPGMLARQYGTHDIAIVSERQSSRAIKRLAALGIPRFSPDDPRLPEVIASSSARWRAGREARLSALQTETASRARLTDALFEVVRADTPQPDPVRSPRVFIAAGTGATEADVEQARRLARYAVADLASATHVALVDGGLSLQSAWDFTLVRVLDMRPDAAVVTTTTRDQPDGLFFAVVFASEQGTMHAAAPAVRGVWLMRRGESRGGPVWAALDAVVYQAPAADRAPVSAR